MTINKVVGAREAVSVIHDRDVIVSSGYEGHGVAEEILAALEQQYIEDAKPRDLALVWAGGQGDSENRGLNHLGYPGLLKRIIGGHCGPVPKIVALAVDEEVEA